MTHQRSGIAAMRLVLSLLLALSAALLASCGGGGGVPYTGVTVRPLSTDFTSRKAVAYSPFRTAANEAGLAAEVIPKANIKEDLDLLLAAGFRAIRLFDSSDKVALQTLEVIRDNNLNIKVQLGAFVLGSSDAASRAEIARCVALAKAFPEIVLAVSVGNETMVSWAFNRIAPALMADYIRSVRSQVTQPVTTDDNYAFWASAPTVITDEIDYVALHTYANLDTWFDPTRWEWRFRNVGASQRAVAMMDAALVETRRQYQEARDHLDRKGLSYLPIIIGETGWNAVDIGRQFFRAHPVNQKMYLDRLQAWVTEGRAGRGPSQIFYFEAFDEPWKQGDDKWGLFNKDRQARYAVQALNLPGAVFGSATWIYEPVIPANDADSNGVYTDADATYFRPPVVNAAVTATRFTLLSDLPIGPTEVRPTGLRWDAFDGNTASYAEVAGIFGPGDASNSLRIGPQPASYGWGLLRQSPTAVTENLSGFADSGKLNFLVSTTYPGKIEIGISSDTQDREGQEAYLQISAGDFGYCNTGAWCSVSIPLSAFKAVNPKLDLSLVASRFIIADRYALTGKPNSAGFTNPIYLDAIHWTK
ncbi:MAG: glycosyl hydrolase family 17 protein [Aquabacterium sp.]